MNFKVYLPVLLIAALMAGIIGVRHSLVRLHVVPDHSMFPALPRRSVFLVNLAAYGSINDVRTGDVVIFHHLENDVVRTFTLRIAGLPGETVQLNSPSENPVCDHPVYVPPNHVYVLGDNPETAVDSRHMGPVPFSAIIGRKLL